VARLAGAGGTSSAGIVGTASSTPSISASSATGGSSWSCVHSPLKAALPSVRPGAVLQKLNCFRFPNYRLCNSGSPLGCGRLRQCWHNASAPATLTTQAFPAGQCPSLSTFHVELRVGRERDRRRNRYQPHLVKQTRIGENIKMSAYRLSVVGSVAPPGTAWDAEGLRGNEANKNKLMVLVRVQARKWQSGRVLHKRTSPVVSSSIGSPASNWEALPAFRLHAGTCVGRELKPDNQTNPRLRGPAVGPASMKRPRRRGQSGGYRRCGAQSPIGHALGALKCASKMQQPNSAHSVHRQDERKTPALP
jgi:hypothetical protein